MPRDEGEIRALGESLISFRLSGSNEGCKANWLHMGVQGKYNTEGSVNRYNAQLEAKCYASKHGVDYNETVTPIAKMMAIVRVLLAMAVVKKWHLHQMDVKNAFP